METVEILDSKGKDALFCEEKCPICAKGRLSKKGFYHALLKLEMAVTGGGCPYCKAREEVFGVRGDELLDPEVKATRIAEKRLPSTQA